MSRTGWDWDLLGPDDEVIDGPVSPVFTSRFDAEAWIGENWRALADDGVAAARLVHRGTPVGEPLPLRRP